jgi:hypothetical protein
MDEVSINPEELRILQEARTENQGLRDEIRELRQRLENLAPTPGPSPRSIPRPVPPEQMQAPKPPTSAPPPMFSGERDRLEHFLDRCRHIFLSSPNAFTQEPQKVLFASGYLAGPAYMWFRPILLAYETSVLPGSQTPTPPEFTSFRKFSQTLMSMYGDPDLEGTMFDELQALTQTTTAAAYAADFRRIIAYIPWQPECFMIFFKKGLRPSVKNLIVGDNFRATTLDELIAQAIKWDNRIIEDIARNKRTPTWHPQNPSTAPRAAWQRPTNVSNTAPSQPSRGYKGNVPQRPPQFPNQYPPATAPRPQAQATTTQSDGTTPMELDQTQRYPYPALTEEQKVARRQFRFENNLCAYCGDAGHRVPECPRSPGNREASRFSAYASATRFSIENPADEPETAKANVQE